MTNDTSMQRNYPYNCWWVAAYASEVGRSLLARWLLDTPVLLYRTEGGEVVAMEDRCPHRQAPLSIGKLKGDVVQCGYHGFEFGSDGACVHVPTMASPPPIKIDTYPVKEIGPLVWVYLGDKSQLDKTPPPPELDWLVDPAFATRSGRMEIAANYLLLKENVLDLTHFGFVHGASFGITDYVNTQDVEYDEEVVRYRQAFDRSPLPPGYAHSLGLQPGTEWNRESLGAMVAPGMNCSETNFYDPDKPGAPANGRIRFAHITTPIDQSRMHYFWVTGRDHCTGDTDMDALAEIIQVGFKEDEDILEAIQARLNRQPRRGGSDERSVRADAAGIQARRIVDRWMKRETLNA
jgi:phenylpropionate dioxygenase-like ring-hydroxylating dioxygenase large terminal subunit